MKHLIPVLMLVTFLVPAAAAAELPITRAQFVSALHLCSGAAPRTGSSPFSDVGPEHPGAGAVLWAWELNLTRGTGGSNFTPDRPITREEAAILLRRYAANLGWDTFLPDGIAACNDYEDISPWADDSLYWAIHTGLMDYNAQGRLEPQGTLTPSGLDELFNRFFHRPVPGLSHFLELWPNLSN